jgi:signal transduction histidine kinase
MTLNYIKPVCLLIICLAILLCAWSSPQNNRLAVDGKTTSFEQAKLKNDLDKEAKRSQSYIIILIIFPILATMIGLQFFKNYRFIKKTNRESIATNQQLQRTINELERTNKGNEKILRVMAHDFRNPISGIHDLVNILLEEEHCQETTHALCLIKNTSHNTILMVDELTKTIFTDDDDIAPTLQEIDVISILKECIKLLEFRAKEKRQKIIHQLPETALTIMGQKENIWRVFTNLLVNAIKFSHPNGIITVATEEKENTIEISISDNGIGIAPHMEEIVFDFFTEAKRNGTTGEKPFGLGLSISKKIIESHAGKIWLKSEENTGTTFYIELPKA